MRALVLSGGGSKGSYEIGVWKALRQLNIKFDIVCGTSVGAINGALIVQNSYFKAVRIWKNIDYKKIFGKEFEKNNTIKNLYKIFAKNFVSNGGTEVKGLQELINKSLNIKKFYKSKINYGLVTFNLSDMKPTNLQKKDISKEKLADFILASSSCFPAFKKKQIDGENYIDGGYYDNLPINFAIDLGADEIIAVDLEAIGIKQKAKTNIKHIIIKPNNELSNFLVFDSNLSKRNMKYGYNDTMKIFNKLDGDKYTFKKKELDKLKSKYKNIFKRTLLEILNINELIQKLSELKLFENEKINNIEEQILDKVIENTGYVLKIDDTKIYTSKSFNKEVKRCIKNDLKYNKKSKYLEMYKLLIDKNYNKLRKMALSKPMDLLIGIYIYTVIGD